MFVAVDKHTLNMQYDFKYESIMKENGLQEHELPSDAITFIKQIKSVLKGISLQEQKGKGASVDSMNKLKTLDKAASNEILDYVSEKKSSNQKQKDEDESARLKSEQEEAAEKKKQEEKEKQDLEAKNKKEKEQQATGDVKEGLEIEKELKSAHGSGNTKMNLEQLREVAPKAYNLIFQTYEPGGENGIRTSKFSVVETEKEIFTISKI